MADRNLTRRRFLMGLAAGAGGTILAACQPRVVKETVVVEKLVKETVVVEKEATAAPAPVEPVTLRQHGRIGTEGDWVMERSAAFEEEYPHIKVKCELIVGKEYWTKTAAMHAAGTIGDTMYDNHGLCVWQPLVMEGYILPLSPMIDAEGFDLGVYFPDAVKNMSIDGVVYALPMNNYLGRPGCFYNQTMLVEQGVALPPADSKWGLDEFVDKAKALTKDTTGDGRIDQFGLLPSPTHSGMFTWLRSFGADHYNEEGTKCTIASEEGIAAFQFVTDLYHKHKVSPTPDQATDKMFETGKIAMFQYGYYGCAKQYAVDFRMGCAMLPPAPGIARVGAFQANDLITNSAKTKHPQEAWELTRWMTNKESGIRLAEVGAYVGARPDCWESPRLMKEPMHVAHLDIAMHCPPYRGPANYRGREIKTAWNQSIPILWAEGGDVRKIVTDTAQQIQEILEMPMVGT